MEVLGSSPLESEQEDNLGSSHLESKQEDNLVSSHFGYEQEDLVSPPLEDKQELLDEILIITDGKSWDRQDLGKYDLINFNFKALKS